MQFYCTAMETADMSASDTNETFLQTAECFLPASLEIKLCMILQKFIFFFSFGEMTSWWNCYSQLYFPILIILSLSDSADKRMCILSREIYKHITLVDSRRGSQKFHQGKLLHFKLLSCKKCMLQNKFMYRTNPIDLKESTYMVSALWMWAF